MNHFSKYAISKKQTLNTVGGAAGGSIVCSTCGDAMITCQLGYCDVFACPEGYKNRIGYKCASGSKS